MRRLHVAGLWAVALVLSAPRGSKAQEASVFPPVGTIAPDIQVGGATRYGLITEPVRLSQFRGNTVVLAFYFRVRGGG